MMSAGLPLVRALHSIARDQTDARLGRMLGQVGNDVQKGDSLATALSRHPEAFGDVFVSLVQTGEVSGTLDEVLEHTAGYLERAELLRLKVQAALRYPTFILSFAGAVLAAMFFKIVPDVLRDLRSVPRPAARAHAAAARDQRRAHLERAVRGSADRGGRHDADDVAAHRGRPGAIRHDEVPAAAVRAAHPHVRDDALRPTLGILLGSGTNILYALRVVRPIAGNQMVGRAIDSVRTQVEGGSSLSRAMARPARSRTCWCR
jgi:type II secretory pathway component PulF